MTASEVSERAVWAEMRGRDVVYTGMGKVPRTRGKVQDVSVDENGRIHLHVRIDDAWWAPLNEWSLSEALSD